MSLKSKIEDHIGIVFFGVLLSGFVGGLAAYSKGLELFHYQFVSNDKLEQSKEERQELKDENRQLREAVISLRMELIRLGRLKESEISSPITQQDIKRQQQEEKEKQKVELEKQKGELAKKQAQAQEKARQITRQITLYGGVFAILILAGGLVFSGEIIGGLIVLLVGSFILPIVIALL